MAQEVPNERSVSLMISYSRKDKTFIQKLHNGLIQQGIPAENVWVDWEGIPLSADWREEIERGIQGSDIFLFVISPDSLSSEVCAEEIEMALKNNKRFVVVLFREPEKGNPMPEIIGATNWVYIRDSDDFDAVLPQLVETLNTDLGWVREHTRILERAIEWEQGSRNKSTLLRGADLQEAENWLAAGATQKQQPTALQIEYIQNSRKDAVRRQRIVTSISVVVAAVLGVLAVLALISRAQAQRQERISHAKSIAAISDQQLTSDPQLALTLSLYSIQWTEEDDTQPQPEALAVLYKSLGSPNILATLDEHTAAVRAVKLCTTQYDIAVTAGADGFAIVWNFFDNRVISTFTGHEGSPITAMDISPDCSRAATVDSDGKALLWDMATGGLIVELPSYGVPFTSVSFNASGSLIATGDEDDVVILSDGFSGEFFSSFFGNHGGITDVEFFPEDDRLATAGKDGFVRIWDPFFNPDPIQEIDAGGFAIVDMAIDHAGRNLAVTDGQTAVSVFDTESGAIGINITDLNGLTNTSGPGGALTSLHGVVNSLEYSRDDSVLYTAGTDIRAWSTWNATLLHVYAGHSGEVYDLADYPGLDNYYFISAGADHLVKFWRLTSGTNFLEQTQGIDFAYFSMVDLWGEFPIYQMVATVGDSVRRYFVSTETTYEDFRFEGHSDIVTSVHYSSDGTKVVSGDAGGTVLIWFDAVEHSFTHDAAVVDAILSPAGDQLAVALAGGRVAVWDVATESLITTIETGYPEVNDIAYNNDNTRLAVSGATELTQGYTQIYDIFEFGLLLTIPQNAAVRTVAFSPDGRYLGTGSNDYTAIVWDPDTGGKIITFNGHSGFVTDLRFSDDSTRLITGSFDRSMRVWDINSGLELFSYDGFKSDLAGVRIDPSGKYIVGVDSSTGVEGVTVGFEELKEIAAGYEIRELTPEECYKYVGTSIADQAANPCVLHVVPVDYTPAP